MDIGKAFMGLADAASQMTKSLNSLSKAIRDWDTKNEKEYHNLDYPFGTSNKGYHIWRKYGQQTTKN